MPSGYAYSTLVFCGGVTVFAFLEFTDYLNGKYDSFRPYPRNPKKDSVDEDIKKIWQNQQYDNTRRQLLFPERFHQFPFATPDHVK